MGMQQINLGIHAVERLGFNSLGALLRRLLEVSPEDQTLTVRVIEEVVLDCSRLLGDWFSDEPVVLCKCRQEAEVGAVDWLIAVPTSQDLTRLPFIAKVKLVMATPITGWRLDPRNTGHTTPGQEASRPPRLGVAETMERIL